MSDADPGRIRPALDAAADWMLRATPIERIALAVASTVAALSIGLVVVTASGHNPVLFINDMLYGAFGTERRLTITLRESSYFILAGVAVAVAFRAGVFNIGVQGQFIVGMLATTMTILWLTPFLPANRIGGVGLMLVGTLGGVLAGGAYGALPGVLKAYADANEIITTIMLNFIAIGVVFYLVDGPFRGEGESATRTASIPEYAELPPVLFEGSGFSMLGLAGTIGVAVVIYVLLTRTRIGYDMVTSGYQESAAVYSGVDAKRTIVGTMTISGMVAGVLGALFIIMHANATPNAHGIDTYGFDAIAVSLLAANHPLGVIPAGALFGGLEAGGQYINVSSDVPPQLIDGIVGLVVLFVAVPELFRMTARRTGLGGDGE